MKKRSQVFGADLFCGAGGMSQGFMLACKELGIKADLTAVNHWDVAIASHSANHPQVRHILDEMQNVKPRLAVGRTEIDVLCAAPECTHHSNAAGGRPKNPQSRATAGFVIRWAKELQPKVIIVENVREFRNWGPLGSKGQVLKRRKGELFNKWVRSLKRLGYSLDHRVLCCANYGDPTTRERLFIIARRDGKPINWPAPTHTKDGSTPTHAGATQLSMFGSVPRWRSAKEAVIDWSDTGDSIFGRRKPLSQNTLNRIFKGLAKFGGEPFMTLLHGTSSVRPATEPVPTVAVSGAHIGVTSSFIVRTDQTGSNSVAEACEGGVRSSDQPVNTVTTEPMLGLVSSVMLRNKHTTINGQGQNPIPTTAPAPAITTKPDLGLASSFMLPVKPARGDNQAKPITGPVPTVTSRGMGGIVTAEPIALASAIIANNGGNDGYLRGSSTDGPLPVVTADSTLQLLTAFILQQQSGGAPRSTEQPIPAIATDGAIGAASAFLIQYNRTAPPQNIDDPLNTVTGNDRFALVKPYLIQYHGATRPGAERVWDVERPAPTIDTSNRLALVIPGFDGVAFDIRYRMLRVDELARAQGFVDYKFTGTKKDQKRQIGNAVPVNTAKALCYSQLQTLA